ncbi:MAG: hypothetical protein H6738_08820 [Alphaproteobacteria bacterium]|nr:hypothetical protein [Alphaproteobacteria bacterium]MCB9696863.1 hypothetical protein [Alphaproteobacteria bacterium]
MTDSPPPVPRAGWAALAAVPLGYAWVAMLAGLCVPLLSRVDPIVAYVAYGVGIVVVIGALGAANLGLPQVRRPTLIAGELTLLVALPLWGLVLDLTSPNCDPCDDPSRPIGLPGLWVVFATYGVGLVGHALLRRRSRWPPVVEALALGALGVGILVCFALAVQFGPLMPMGIAFAPMGLPLVAPLLISLWWTGTWFWRASRSFGPALGALGLTTTWAVADVGATWAAYGKIGVLFGAFTETCGWTMSTLVPPPTDCHYLCTVAAQGHPWLVRPTRMGTRRGQPIVVNRQLAVANAFEDLIHERWPRTGRFLRRTYDRLAFPVSRWLLNPLAADAMFVAMLPAQAFFELFLRTFDRESPEARIDRMYR